LEESILSMLQTCKMKIGIFCLLSLVFTSLLSGQCPEKKYLWNRIIFLRDTSTIASQKQLNELLYYKKKIAQCKLAEDSVTALLLQRIGWLYSKENDFFNAIQYTKKSIALIENEKKNPAINPSHAIKSYFNLQILCDSLKLEEKKWTAIDSCIFIGLRLHSGYQYLFPALILKIKQLFENGDYYRCIYFTELGESFVKSDNNTISYAEDFYSESFHYKINSLIFLKKYSQAEEMVNEKIKIYEKEKNSTTLGTLYGLNGQVKRDLGDIVKAIYYFEKAFQKNKIIKYPEGCAEALSNIGFIYSNKLQQNKKAILYHLKALKFASANEALNIYDNIANIFVQEGNYDSAFFFFQKAFDQFRHGFSESDLLKNYETELPVTTTAYTTGMVIDKAGAWLNKYNVTGNKKALEEAIRIYEIIDRYFDKLKTSQHDIQSRLFWKTDSRRLYEHAIAACYAGGNVEKAFYFFEKSRSVLLNDEILEQRNMSDVNIAKQAQLKKNILEIESNLKNIQVSSKVAFDLQQQLLTNKQELIQLLKNTDTQHSSINKNYIDNTALTLASLRQKVLITNKSLLEIFSGDRAVYVLAVTSQKTSFIQIDKHLYDSLTTAYISLISKPILLNKDVTAFTEVSHQLYKLIFQNLQLNTGGSLIVSPDGKGFPFEALVTSVKNGQPQYLLNQYATSYTYSANYLMEYAANTTTSNSMLGMAPVKYAGSMGLEELPGSDLSLQKIKNEFPGATNLVFEKATRHNFFQQFPSNAIVQLYTHAADSSTNNDPVIYFADSSMLLSELIIDRKPITQLIVLSACETANGKLYEGEGIFSFNRGFAALGIPAAISNLWSVENESTYAITELFYKYLAQGLPTDIALQKAKIDFISSSTSKEKKLPYYWAGPILTGKVDTITGEKSMPWKTILITVAAVIAAGIFTKKYFLKRQHSSPTVSL
jgi:CHAT domain-containing protein/DNA-binding XRE family transcriptional regulator